jgi:hypothetical protein
MDVAAVREHFQYAQGAGAQRQSALAVRTRSGVAINVWRTYGARLRAGEVVRRTAARPAWLGRGRAGAGAGQWVLAGVSDVASLGAVCGAIRRGCMTGGLGASA